MNILLISNMYPSKKHPDFGIFVERIVKELEANNNNIHLCVRDSKGENKLAKVISYLTLYFKTIISYSLINTTSFIAIMCLIQHCQF
ncbi:hypothetical protein [Enterobacter hormaechei]|uniref:hypothetical protein n=1 Tax=Enterobacter hormaechei TaxID=158836 RepID=UPI00388D2A83